MPKLHKQYNENTNIILIGMPGCGKSTCGVLIAKALCTGFLDTDLLIQTREGASLQEIINSRGFDYFTLAEERALLSIRHQNCVIATGGSAVYSKAGMLHLKKNGIVVYLKVGLEEMVRRITDISTRGILLRKDETIEDLYQERAPLYKHYADVTVDCDKKSIEDVVQKVCRVFSSPSPRRSQ